MSLQREDTKFDIAAVASSITGLTQDSRKVQEGYLFAAFKGRKSDGTAFIEQAIQNGANYILLQSGIDVPDMHDSEGVVYLNVSNPREIFAKIAAAFYKNQPENIVAVTGTNGKTSVVHFTKQLWSAQGFKAESIGTLGGALTTPDPVGLHAHMAELSEGGVTYLAMEASSHGLDQYRLDGVKVSAAGFTNITRDHLDYHNTMEAYTQAKTRLFIEVLSSDGTAVINSDSRQSKDLIKAAEARGIKIFTYGHAGRDLKLVSVEPIARGQRVALEILGERHEIEISLVGEFQVMNVLCALGLVLANGREHQAGYINAIEKLRSVPGRLQYVGGHPAGASVYVDYAHTPDALETVLNSLRPHLAAGKGRLICVFGCGGDRDIGKRPQMGEIASRLADEVIVSDDNPRSEDPASIRAQIMAGISEADYTEVKNISGRKAAILVALESARAEDIILLAGKGHEQGQIFADRTDPFDDVEEVQKAINTLKKGQSAA